MPPDRADDPAALVYCRGGAATRNSAPRIAGRMAPRPAGEAVRLRAILTLAMAAVGGVAVAVAIVLIAVTSAMSQAGLALDRLRRHIDRLESMVGDLMDRTRIEAGQFELHLDTAHSVVALRVAVRGGG